MDTHSPAKTKGTIAAGQSWPAHGTTRKLAVRVTPLLPFTGSMERSVSGGCIAPRHPLSTNKSLTRTDCVHRLKIPSQGTRKLLHHMLMSSTKTEGEGERKKKNPLLFLVTWIREKQGYSPQRSHPFPFSAAIPQNRWAVPPEGQDKFS